MPIKKKPTKAKSTKPSLDMMVMGNMPMGIEKIPSDMKGKKMVKKPSKKSC
jgi:hypothetical protein